MEVTRDHPTPYPGRNRSRVSVRSSVKVQENKLLTEMSSLTKSSLKRQEHSSSISKNVNASNFLTKEKPSKSRKGLLVPSKCATVVPKTETKESPVAVSDSTCTSSKPFLHQRAVAVKSDKAVAAEAKAKSSKKKHSVSFEDSSIRSQIKDIASNKDALLTSAGSINSMVPVTPEHPNNGHRSKLNTLTSSSYWLDQIKISESAGKHAISLGFFRLALESAAEPLQRLHDELKEYALKYNLLEFGELAKGILETYGVLEEIMSADSSGKPAKLDASAEGTFSEPKVFMLPIHELSSVCTDNAENSSDGETTRNAKVDCPPTVETEGFSIVSEFKSVTDSFLEESKVYHLKVDKDAALKDDIKESVNDKSSGMLSGLMGSKTQVLSKEHLVEGEAIGNEYVQQSIPNQESCIDDRNLNETEKVASVSSSMIGGTVLDKKNAIQKGTKCGTMPGTGSQLYARKSSKLNSAQKAGTSKALRSTTRHSCTLITSTKKDDCVKKNARQDDKKGTNLSDFCPSDLSSTHNGEEKDRDNQPFQTMDRVNQCEDIKGFASVEYTENRESGPNYSISEGSGLDALNMSVDTLMAEVVSCIMSSMDDCTDSPEQIQGHTLNSLEDNIVDTVESNSRDKIMSPPTSRIPDINHPFGIVCENYTNNTSSSIRSTDLAADRKEEMREDLDGISCTESNVKELGADMSCISEEEQGKNFENVADETVQLGAENDGVEQNRKVELRKSKPYFTKSRFQGSKAVTGKGSLKNDQNNVSNSNKENIFDKICGVPLMQTESSGNLVKEVKALDGPYEGDCQNPGNCTPGSIRRSTRLKGRTVS